MHDPNPTLPPLGLSPLLLTSSEGPTQQESPYLNLDLSMFNPPVPHFNTFWATVNPFSNGFLARHAGSAAGFKAVPHHCNLLASSVAGAVS